MNQTSIDSRQSMGIKKIAKRVEKVMVLILLTIQFGSFDPIEIKKEVALSTLQEHAYEDEKALQPDVNDEGWTLVR